MLHELRVYTLKPGTAAAAAETAATLGKDIRGDRYGKLEGYFTTDVGPLNRAVHFWSHDSYEARTKNRAGLGQNERWVKEYVPLIREKMLHQDVRILNPIIAPRAPEGTDNLYELRFYKLKPTMVKSWLDLFQSKLAVREKYSKIVALWHTEANETNEVVHLWAHKNFEARTAARIGSSADKEWQEYVKASRPMIDYQDSWLMMAAPHSPLR